MKLETTLDDLQRTVSLCIKDGMCTYGKWPQNNITCPIYAYHGVYTASGGGLIYLLRALAEGKTDYNPAIAKYAYQCSLCGACDMCEIVPIPSPHATPTDLIRFLRNLLVQNGMVPDKISKLRDRLIHGEHEAINQPLLTNATLAKREKSNSILLVDKSETATQAAIHLLDKMGTSFSVLEASIVGARLYDLGFWTELSSYLEGRLDEYSNLEGREVIFTNPHLQEFFVKTIPEIMDLESPFEAFNMSEVLARAFDEGKLVAKNGSLSVAYHDPCRLVRGLDVHESPRKVLSYLDAELKEMVRNGDDTFCCGSGSGNATFNNFSEWVCRERLKDFEETGARLLITACPYCKAIFRRILPEERKDDVKHLIELVEENIIQ